MKYYYANAANQAVGPFEASEIARLAQSGTITEQTNVIAEGSQTWMPYGQLRQSISAPPPPPSPMPAPVPPAPRKRMGSGMKVALAITVAVFVAVAAGGVLWHTVLNRPSGSAIAAFVTQKMSRQHLKVRSVNSSTKRLEGGRVQVSYTAQVETPEPFYQSVDIRAFLQDQMGVDVGKLLAAQAQAPNVDPTELANLGTPPTDPLSVTVLKLGTPAGAAIKYAGILLATKSDKGWMLTEDGEGQYSPHAPEGSVRGEVRGQSFVIGNAADAAALRTIVDQANVYANKVAEALPADMPAGVKTVVKLAKAGVGEDAILTQVHADGTAYKLTAPQIVYLSKVGVPQNVIKALLEGNPSASPTVAASSGLASQTASTESVPTADAGTLSQGLIAYYPLNSDARDASGNGRDGQLVNSPTFVQGGKGSALYLRGGGRFDDSGPHVNLPFIPLAQYPEFTISLWARVDDVIAEAELMVVYGSSPGGEIGIGVSPDGHRTFWECGIGGNMHTTWTDPNPDALSYVGGWKHYVMIYNRGMMTGYIDGHKIMTATIDQLSVAGQTAGIGVHWFPGYPGGVSTRFIGAIEEVRIYNRACTPAEVTQLANVSASPASTQLAEDTPEPQPAQPAQPPPPAVFTISVPANVRWVNTGVDLAPGQSVAISANGLVSVGVELPIHISFLGTHIGTAATNESPNGDPTANSYDSIRPFVAPGMPAYSLVGKVGDSAPFYVGSTGAFTAPVAGRLYLCVNANTFDSNTGLWNVTLTLGQGGAAPMVQAGPPAQVSFDYFHDQLAPYGNWVQTSYGWCWSPAVAAADGGWRPYSDQGQWVYTDNGWFWQSEYSWGDIAFHYGRWYRDMSYGWLWVPDYTWAPAWVCWRNAEADGYFGWAALPPGARFVAGEGLYFDGRLAMDIDFGLGWDAFVFVSFDHFWDHDYRHFLLFGDRAAFMYRRSVILNGYRMVGGRFVIDGLGRDRIARFTHRDVRVEDVRNMRAREERTHVEARRVEAVRAGRQPDRAPDNHGPQGRPSAAPGDQHQAAPQAKPSNAKPAPAKPQQNDEKKENQQ
jgi:hypothetical protein